METYKKLEHYIKREMQIKPVFYNDYPKKPKIVALVENGHCSVVTFSTKLKIEPKINGRCKQVVVNSGFMKCMIEHFLKSVAIKSGSCEN